MRIDAMNARTDRSWIAVATAGACAFLIALGAFWGGREGIDSFQSERAVQSTARGHSAGGAGLGDAIAAPVVVTRTTEDLMHRVEVVARESQGPIPGATVAFAADLRDLLAADASRRWTEETDQAGVVIASHERLPDRESFWIFVFAEGFGAVSRPIRGEPGRGTETVVPLDALETLHVRVVDPDGEPVEGAEVSLRAPGAKEAAAWTQGCEHPLTATLSPRASTDADGRVQLTIARSAEYFHLAASKPYYASASIDSVREPDFLRDRELIVSPILVAGLAVRDPGTGNVSERSASFSGAFSVGPGQRVYWAPQDSPFSISSLSELMDRRLGTTNVRWKFACPRGGSGVEPRSGSFTGRADGRMPETEHSMRFRPLLEFGIEDLCFVDVVDPDSALATLRVRFLTPDGIPSAPAGKWYLQQLDEGPGFSPRKGLEQFEFRIPPGDYRLKCIDPDWHGRSFEDRDLRMVAGEDATVEVALVRGFASIEARAVDEWGLPVLDWDLMLLKRQPEGAQVAWHDESDPATVRIPMTVAGPVTIMARDRWRRHVTWESTIESGEHRSLKFTFADQATTVTEESP